MESRIRVLLLNLAALSLAGCASMHWPWRQAARQPTADEAAAASQANAKDTDSAPPDVVQPQVERRQITVPKIHAKDIELGAYYGELSIEDFGAQPVAGWRFDYHISEDFFFEATYGRAKGGETSYELLNGNVQLLTNAERRFTYYNLSLGYNVLPGEVFIGRNLAMTSALYLLGGIGNTQFAGNDNFTVNFGAGYRILPTDWLALHIDVQDLVFRSDLFGVEQLKDNLQATIGATVFF
jgi:outer membrane beta-barrel protein